MLDSKQVLSDIIVFQKYAKYLPELNRRETWAEINQRIINMMVKKYPQLRNQENSKVGPEIISPIGSKFWPKKIRYLWSK